MTHGVVGTRPGARFAEARGPMPQWWHRGQGGRENGRQPVRGRKPGSSSFDLCLELAALAANIESLVIPRLDGSGEQAGSSEEIAEFMADMA